MTDSSSAVSPTNSMTHLPPVDGEPQRSLIAIVARNTAFVLGVQVVLKILAFLFNIYVVRRLGDVHFGQYSAVMAYVAMFAIFTDWGMSPYAVREMAKDPTQTSWLLPNIVAIRVVLSLIITIVAPLSALWLGKEDTIVLGILIASAGLILYAFQGPLSSALTARERLDVTSTFALVNQLIFWGLGVLLLIRGMGFIGLLIASLAGVAVVALLSGWALFKMGMGRLALSVRRWPKVFLAALPFGVSGISNVFMQRSDTVLMSFVLTDAAVGWYNVPWTLINMVLLIAQSIAIAMYPSMVRSHTGDPESLPQVVWQAIKYLTIVCLPIVVGGTVLADRIIITLYEETFVNSIAVLQVMLWALPSLFLLELLGRVGSTLHLERPGARINVINAVVTVVLNLILVPTLGILGAALALVGGRTILLVQTWKLIGNDRLVGQRWGSLLRVVSASAAMGTIVFFLRQVSVFGAVDSKVGLLALIGSGAVVYVVVLLTLGGIERREMAFLRTMVQERLARGGAR
ncbi:MAG: oligosaccharide flippase family protein [Anaerolineae bacterium]|nr:MAG: oligosaccharide flippase family protein [Anaerolineae bacterium]